jgi:hypothetical protein
MGSDGKNNGDGGPALGWDLFRLKWVAEPPVALAAALYGVLFIIFLLIAISGVVALWQLLAPIWTGASPAPSSQATDTGAELRGRLLVIGAMLTTPFLVWRLIVGHWSARAAQEQARIAQETARNTLFTKAIEQLGAVREEKTVVKIKDANGVATSSTEESAIRPNTEVRLGAIYALEKLARDDLEMHWPIMETLCAYIRENAGKPKQPPANMLTALSGHWRNRLSEKEVDDFKRDAGRPSVDVQAPTTVIGRRAPKQREYERARREDKTSRTADAWRLDLSNCHLALANFAGLDFTAAQFSDGSLYLSDFYGATLTGAAFVKAHLEGASFHLARLESAGFNKGHLEGATLTKAHVEGASFNEASLRGRGSTRLISKARRSARLGLMRRWSIKPISRARGFLAPVSTAHRLAILSSSTRFWTERSSPQRRASLKRKSKPPGGMKIRPFQTATPDLATNDGSLKHMIRTSWILAGSIGNARHEFWRAQAKKRRKAEVAALLAHPGE